VKYWPVFKIL